MSMITDLFLLLCLSAVLTALASGTSKSCSDNTQCLNGGTCVVNVDRLAHCKCAVQFLGDRCQFHTNTTLCNKQPCKNGGSCGQEPDEATVTCFCMPGYHGTYCDLNYNDCLSSPCVHGRCVDKVNDYECNCTGTIWTGPDCDVQRSRGHHTELAYLLLIALPLTVLIVAVIRIYMRPSCCKRRRRHGPYAVLDEELYSPDNYSIPMTRRS